MTHLTLTIDNTDQARATWQYLTQSSSEVAADIGDTILNFLTNRLGMEEEYIDSQVKTIFIDGKPVDDITTATIPENARIALGAIAPGAAGMTMCRNSPISSLRSGITYTNTAPVTTITEGVVTLLLFNAVMKDMGLQILEKGVTIPAAKLEQATKEAPDSILSATLDETSITPEELLHWVQKNPQTKIHLRVTSTS
ncbi:hypothetical protein [Halodesulfovibrio sp.]|jgi:hypothetical protein|uniref:hypothetical protein n=1 Tax=Halodesulfovibrio sp. TaxID=1912772 RepID=UPI0025F6DBD9|nr:hypothetical protein [Halodesulfovibrio sp.]MCT4626827.1 hypothetical protein [Halodesulfovibrio sp.]